MKQKPEKIIYENQEEVLNKIINFVKNILDENVEEAYLFGSLVNREFGRYVQKYKNHEGSDIDLIIFIKGEKVPDHWKYLNTQKEFWKLYRAGRIEINGVLHKIDALVVNKKSEEIAKKSNIFMGKVLKVK